MHVRYHPPIKAQSILTNGDFSTLDNWVVYRGTCNVNNHIAQFTTTTDEYSTLYQDRTLIAGHIYFYYIKNRITSPAVSGQYFKLMNNGASPTQSITQINLVQNKWYEMYLRVPNQGTGLRYEPQFFTNGVVSIVEYTNPLVIDLTAAFGSGNEPTGEQFYNQYHIYFEQLMAGDLVVINDGAGHIAYGVPLTTPQPLQVTNLLGQQNTTYTFPNNVSDNGYLIYAKNNNSFEYGQSSQITSIAKPVSVILGHKYFVYTSWYVTTTIYTNVHNGHRFVKIADTSVDTGNPTTFAAGTRYAYSLIEANVSGNCMVGTRNYNQTQVANDTVNYMIVIDLTAIGLDNLTAAQFYNQYNSYFETIAAGGAVTIDTHTYYTSNCALTSIVGDQSILTKDDSFQEYGITEVTSIAIGKQAYGYSTVPKSATKFTTADNIYITNGHKYFCSIKFHNMLDRSSQSWMACRLTSPVSMTTYLTQIKYSYQWYFTTDRINMILDANDSGYATTVLLTSFEAPYKINVDNEYPVSYSLIDLTELFGAGNEPTVQNFYSTYHGLFKDVEEGKGFATNWGQITGGDSNVYYRFNSIIKDGNFESNTSTYTVRTSFTCSVANNIATWTRTDVTAPDWYVGFMKCTTYARQYQHKWYVSYYARTSSSVAVTLKAFPDYNAIGVYHPLSSTWTRCEDIGPTNFAASEVNFWFISEQSLLNQMAVGDTIEMKQLMYIDLTEMFGAGNEPTTVQALKEILNVDYLGNCTTPISLTKRLLNATPIYGYNQRANNTVSTRTLNGITMTNNGNGSYSFQGTATADSQFGFCYPGTNNEDIVNHKFIIRGAPISSTYNTYYIRNNNRPNENQVDLGYGAIFTWTASYSWVCQVFIKSGTVINKPVTFWPQCIDLTTWFGAGNEPSTIEEFNNMFPNAYYPFSDQRRLLNRYMINELVD